MDTGFLAFCTSGNLDYIWDIVDVVFWILIYIPPKTIDVFVLGHNELVWIQDANYVFWLAALISV